MLRHRLLFGTLMTVCFAGISAADLWLDGVLAGFGAGGGPVRGTLICTLVALLVIPCQLEFSRLAAFKGLRVFLPVVIPASILLATVGYWGQFRAGLGVLSVNFLLAFFLMAVLVYQYSAFGTSGVIGNCGANCLSIFYLGVLSSFVAGIRIEFGLYAFLMFVFSVKSSDIGAYAVGSVFGRHKFSPRISPGKSWEGMFGALLGGSIVAVGVAVICDIMSWWSAAIFGVCFGFIGQMGDLAESMLKRDAGRKDSAGHVPGFGGLLDVIDSPLIAAPFAYLFFMFGS